MAAIDAFAGNARELSRIIRRQRWAEPQQVLDWKRWSTKDHGIVRYSCGCYYCPELEMVHLKIVLWWRPLSRIRKELKKVRAFGCVFGRVSHMKSWRKTFSRMDVTKSTEQLQQDGRDQKYRTASLSIFTGYLIGILIMVYYHPHITGAVLLFSLLIWSWAVLLFVFLGWHCDNKNYCSFASKDPIVFFQRKQCIGNCSRNCFQVFGLAISCPMATHNLHF